VCGLIGPNGAGKTTTMRAVSGLQECTRGSVKIDGHQLAREPEELKRRLVSCRISAPSMTSLPPRNFLDHFARAYDVPDRTKRIEGCLELTWLTEKRDALCEELSRGMKQRLVLAKRCCPTLRYYCWTNPPAALTRWDGLNCGSYCCICATWERRVLISSHILTKLSGFCNTAAIMERGKLVMSGTIAELGQKMGRRQMSVKWRNGRRPRPEYFERRGRQKPRTHRPRRDV